MSASSCQICCPVKQHCLSGMLVFMDCCQDDLLESPKLAGTVSREFLLSITIRLVKQSKMSSCTQYDRTISHSLSRK